MFSYCWLTCSALMWECVSTHLISMEWVDDPSTMILTNSYMQCVIPAQPHSPHPITALQTEVSVCECGKLLSIPAVDVECGRAAILCNDEAGGWTGHCIVRLRSICQTTFKQHMTWNTNTQSLSHTFTSVYSSMWLLQAYLHSSCASGVWERHAKQWRFQLALSQAIEPACKCHDLGIFNLLI